MGRDGIETYDIPRRNEIIRSTVAAYNSGCTPTYTRPCAYPARTQINPLNVIGFGDVSNGTVIIVRYCRLPRVVGRGQKRKRKTSKRIFKNPLKNRFSPERETRFKFSDPCSLRRYSWYENVLV